MCEHGGNYNQVLHHVPTTPRVSQLFFPEVRHLIQN